MNTNSENPIVFSMANSSTGKICVVCPCYHEEQGIHAFYTELKQTLSNDCSELEHEIIFVDDGSRDGTLYRLQEIEAQDPAVYVYSLARNQGHQSALSAGLNIAKGDAVLMMDSDLQHPPALIPELVGQWQLGHDVVLAVREQTQGASLFKRLTSNGFYWLFNVLSDVKLTPGAADFCLLSEKAHQALCNMPEQRRFLRGMIAWMGFETARVSYTAPERFAGESSYGVGRMLKLAMDATISFSTRPIRLATKAGASVRCRWIAISDLHLRRYLVLGDLSPGWPRSSVL